MSILFLGWRPPNDELVGEDHGSVPACVIFADVEPGGGSLHKHPYAELSSSSSMKSRLSRMESRRAWSGPVR
jgi:hypothetical protein